MFQHSTKIKIPNCGYKDCKNEGEIVIGYMSRNGYTVSCILHLPEVLIIQLEGILESSIKAIRDDTLSKSDRIYLAERTVQLLSEIKKPIQKTELDLLDIFNKLKMKEFPTTYD